MIQVITHNGLPPAQGGRTLGYLFSTNGGGTAVVPASQASLFTPPPAPVPMKTADPVRMEQAMRTARVNMWDEACCPECEARNGNVRRGGVKYCWQCGTGFKGA